MLPLFLVVDLDLILKKIYFEIELKVLVVCLPYDMIVWLQYTGNDNEETRIVAT